MVKGCYCVICRAARALGNFKIARGWKERDAEKEALTSREKDVND